MSLANVLVKTPRAETSKVDNAIGLIEAIRPPWSDVQREAFLGIATADAVSKGLVGIHDARAPVADLTFYKRCVFPHLSRRRRR